LKPNKGGYQTVRARNKKQSKVTKSHPQHPQKKTMKTNNATTAHFITEKPDSTPKSITE
jgi:hypothetical protein